MTTDHFISPEVLTLISSKVAWAYRIVPFEVNSGKVSLLHDNEDFGRLQDELVIVLKRDVDFHIIDSKKLDEFLSKYYRLSREKNDVSFETKTLNLQSLIREAKELGSSDIHVEVYKSRARVRLRIDGHLIEKYALELNTYQNLINKIKISAQLDISEKRLPQDGRIRIENGTNELDLRVSIIPSLYGEKAVLRILGSDASRLELSSLGMNDVQMKDYLKGIRASNGIILISGPTGSGKTTTLYATLKILNAQNVNIATVEDPVEYILDGINQIQAKDQIGLTFSSALRSFLRQDPDIIMVGEIRDVETAQMAIRASLTGHLVLSTIHTNDALGIVTRLIDMGIPNFLLQDTLRITVAQRLIRLLCEACKSQDLSDYKIANNKNVNYSAQKSIYKAVGCEKCYYTGYKGRIALYEVIPLTSEIFRILKSEPENIEKYMADNNITLLKDSAKQLLMEGKTSFNEVFHLI